MSIHNRTDLSGAVKVAYTFLVDGEKQEQTLTFQQLDEQARAIAVQLGSLNAAGERALLLYAPGLDFIAGYFGCLYAGVVAVPTYPPRRRRRDERLVGIALDSQATIALTTSDILLGGNFTRPSISINMTRSPLSSLI